MKINHQIIGYDRDTDDLAVEYDIPPACLDQVGAVIGIAPEDPQLVGSYPLIPDQVRRIAKILRRQIDSEKFDFFIEPYAD
ncbi:MAG TPA: hypothetical protein VH020_14205 [Stellaceae bacterium]|jgi:hypothetical protein|nr:hypothetical protein [Stellaceae bacterium]